MNPAKRAEIFRRSGPPTRNPTTELRIPLAFELLVAVVLSAQATDKRVNAATRVLYRSPTRRRRSPRWASRA